MIGLHLQRPVDGWPRSLNKLPAGTWIKAVDNVQALDEAKRHNPKLKTVLRHWYDHGQIFDTTDQNILRDRARTFFSTFIDGTFRQYAAQVDAIEEFNEYNASSHSGIELEYRVAWADAVSWVWDREYRTQDDYTHIRLVLGNVAIGNDLPWQYAKFAHERDCILGYHPYVPVRDKVIMPDEWPFYSGRWVYMDADFRDRGYCPQWLFTEFGPVGYNPPASLNANDGWRHPSVCNGDVGSYLAVIDYWLNKTQTWNQANGHRALGAVLFTTGGGSHWQWFETRQPEIDTIANHISGVVISPPVPCKPKPPPEPPKPPEIRRYSRTIHLLPQNATIEQTQAVMGRAYVNRESVTFSADDSAINPDPTQANLKSRTIRTWGEPPGGSQSAWEAWLKKHYPPLPTVTYHLWADIPSLFSFGYWPTLYKTGGILGGGINQLFGANPDIYKPHGYPGHEGIDFHSTIGDPIFAVANGMVTRVHDVDSTNYGVNVRVIHQDGYMSIYAHLSAVNVSKGQEVAAGDIIGFAGSTGNSTGPHLHLTLRYEGARAQKLTDYPKDEVDPFPYLAHML